jgi:hypothetical protein
MPARIHHEKCDITITEVKVMLSWDARLVIAVGIINTERILGIYERWCVVGLANVIVDDL